VAVDLAADERAAEDIAPQQTVAEDAAPNDTAPKDTAPKDTAPKDTAPKDTASTDTSGNSLAANDGTDARMDADLEAPVTDHTVERRAVRFETRHAVDAAPIDDFDDQKTAEVSLVAVPLPISMGPRAAVVANEATTARPAETNASSPLPAGPALLMTPLDVLARAGALYDDDDPARREPPPLAPFDPPPTVTADDKTVDIILFPPPATRDVQSAEASHLSTDEGVTVEGAPVDEQRTDQGPAPPSANETFVADDGTSVRLEDPLGEQSGMVFFKARLSRDGVDAGQPFTAVWMPHALPEPPWDRLPDNRIVRPRCRVTLERAAIRVFERPKGNTVIDYLLDDDKLLPAMATIELGIELAELVESLHGAGFCLHDLDPSQIVIERGGRVRLYAVAGLWAQGSLPHGTLGVFCAPEVRRRLRYRVTAASDVYAIALLLYALLARRAPLDIDTDPIHLVTPRVFRPECPLGVWTALRPCLDANPARRVGHARALRDQLEVARQRLIRETQATEAQTPVTLEGWAEQHAGITKARRGSGQQDRALSVTDASGRIGLYVIADGVSRSKFGDGAFAAEQVEVAALQRWSGLEKAGPQGLALEHAQRADILRQVARSAGKRIATEVNARCAPIPNEPNQVMSATLVAAFVVDGDCTIGNLGDSRAYLIRDRTIEQITIDHDRSTDALRLGLSFREASHVQMGTALTRVVGRVVVDDDGTCRPDPFEPEIFRLRLLPGDRLLLCSDGVADFAAGAGAPQHEQDAKMLQCVLEHDDPARAAFELVVLANRAGGYDNISCVVLAAHGG
jgi:serine/threonine protein phosphatase PrpC